MIFRKEINLAKKIFMTLVLSTIFILIGCSQNNSKKSFLPNLDTEKKLSLNVLGVWGNFEALEQVFTDFNQIYPNISLNYEYVDNMTEASANRCASADNIDLIFVQSLDFKSDYNEIIDKYLIDLKTTGIDFSTIDKQAINSCQIDGKLNFLPIYFYTTGLMVNESLLKKNGFKIPTSNEEFKNICNYFVENGTRPIYLNKDFSLTLIFDFIMSKLENETGELISKLEEGKISKDVFEEGLQLLRNLKEKKYFNFDGSNLKDSYGTLIGRFLEGDIPFMLANSDTISGTKKRESKSEAFQKKSFEYTYIPMSTLIKSGKTFFQPSLLFGICNCSENLDYAIEFMRFLTTEKELKSMTVIKGMPSVFQKTGDYRLKYFENVPHAEKLVIGNSKISKKVANTIYDTLLCFNDLEIDAKELCQKFEDLFYEATDIKN